jgi:hypothetical protein
MLWDQSQIAFLRQMPLSLGHPMTTRSLMTSEWNNAFAHLEQLSVMHIYGDYVGVNV